MSKNAFAISATAGLMLIFAGTVQGQDAMAPDAMVPMMSDGELAQCIEQAKAITFSEVAMVAEQACHSLHNGQSAMGGGAMMAGDAMAPKQ